MSVRATGWTAVCDYCGSDYGIGFDEREEADEMNRECDGLCAECTESGALGETDHG